MCLYVHAYTYTHLCTHMMQHILIIDKTSNIKLTSNIRVLTYTKEEKGME